MAGYKQVAIGRKQLHLWAFTQASTACLAALVACLKVLKLLSKDDVQAIFNFLRAIWHTFPWPRFGEQPPIVNLAVMASALFGFIFYTAGSGFGNPRNETRGILLAYGVIAVSNSALIALAFIFYHLKRDEPLYHLSHAGAFISRLSAGHDKDASTHALLWMAEAFVDMIGMAIGFEAGKHAVNYFFLARSSNQKKKSS